MPKYLREKLGRRTKTHGVKAIRRPGRARKGKPSERFARQLIEKAMKKAEELTRKSMPEIVVNLHIPGNSAEKRINLGFNYAINNYILRQMHEFLPTYNARKIAKKKPLSGCHY